jgi:hypothetical protein
MDTLEIAWRMEGCAPGVDSSRDNPLARATECLFRLGQPFSRLSKCFFCGPDGVTRWLGIFVHSAGDRLLFFPGFAEEHTQVLAYSESVIRWNQPFHFDHLSLEPDRRTWHLTTPQSKHHLGKLYTRQLGDDRVHWFSMSAAAPSQLRVVREETRASAPTPPQDVDRRAQVFRNARESAIFQIVGLNTEHPSPRAPAFLHFSVVVGPKGFISPENELLGLPYGSPFLPSVTAPDSARAPIRIHRILLSDDIELEITASSHPGQLQTDALFTAPLPDGKSSNLSAQA